MDNRGKDDPVSASTVTSSDKGLDSRRWWALAAVSLAAFMTYLDNNIVNVAIPTIQRSLHLSVSGLEWVVSSYLLTVAGLLLVGGRLADVFGRRRLFHAGKQAPHRDERLQLTAARVAILQMRFQTGSFIGGCH